MVHNLLIWNSSDAGQLRERSPPLGGALRWHSGSCHRAGRQLLRVVACAVCADTLLPAIIWEVGRCGHCRFHRRCCRVRCRARCPGPPSWWQRALPCPKRWHGCSREGCCLGWAARLALAWLLPPPPLLSLSGLLLKGAQPFLLVQHYHLKRPQPPGLLLHQLQQLPSCGGL